MNYNLKINLLLLKLIDYQHCNHLKLMLYLMLFYICHLEHPKRQSSLQGLWLLWNLLVLWILLYPLVLWIL